jgi:hypothetical protein
MLVAEGAVEIRVLRRQGETARWLNRATSLTVSKPRKSVKKFQRDSLLKVSCNVPWRCSYRNCAGSRNWLDATRTVIEQMR